MKNIWKILKIIILFFVSLFVISFIWYNIEIALHSNENANIPFIDYVMYLIGYGEIDICNHYSKTAFSAIGLFCVTLLSSVFTVNLFELRNKAKISPALKIRKTLSGQLIPYVEIKTAGRNVFDIKATLITKIDDCVSEEEKYIPFFSKKSLNTVKFSIGQGSVLYKYLRSALKGVSDNLTLILKLSYTDIENAQEYAVCKRFCYEDSKKRFLLYIR